MKNISNDNHTQEGHQKKSLLKVIREKCIDCCGGEYGEVRKCHITDCPLWPYKMGKNPFRKRKMTEKQKREAADRLKNL